MKNSHILFTLLINSLLCLTLITGTSFTSNAQVYEIVDHIKRAATARSHIRQLHEGTLVVRLRSKKNNIDAMEKVLANSDMSTKSRRRLEKKLQNTIEQRNKENKAIVKHMSKSYNFSNYLIVYDNDIHQLYSKEESGYFLNEQLEFDPNISIDFSQPFYVLGYGLTSASDNNRREGLILTDANKKTLEAPFPYYAKMLWPPFSSISSFFGNNNLTADYKRMIERYNSSLAYYYTQSQLKNEKDRLKKEMKKLKEEKN